MKELAVYLKDSGQGFVYDAIALRVVVKCDRCFTRSSPLYADGCVGSE
ncbi:hypothetical protein [Coleofasciculus sp. FACHB-1120]|nr:hypothetical protein [Coleofasciculus sp. FACHB-1120]MBD2741569.1 hypothetical protein [Coleofasciculus sp. FACHB-1120]